MVLPLPNDIHGAELNIKIRRSRPGGYSPVIIFSLVLFLTVFGAILTSLGYNDQMDRIWGHIGLASLIIGSFICPCSFAYITLCSKEITTDSVYQSLPNVDAPTSSETDNSAPEFKNRRLRQGAKFEPNTLEQDSRQKQDADADILATRDLLNKAIVGVLAIQSSPNSSSNNNSQKQQRSGSESTQQSKSSIYVSTEMQPNESCDSAAESETKSLLSYGDTKTKIQTQFEATI